MTFQTLFLVGCASVVRETWQEPPPWVAPPMKVSGCLDPRAIVFAGSLGVVNTGALLAGEVRTIGSKRRIVKSRFSERFWGRHLHVCRGKGCKSEDCESSGCKLH